MPDAPATEDCPDHSTCQHCHQPISWDDWCYTHDHTGFADCGVKVSGGTPVSMESIIPGLVGVLDPTITQLVLPKPTRAEPMEWKR